MPYDLRPGGAESQTALHHAAEVRWSQCNHSTGAGLRQTALHHAAEGGHATALAVLLAAVPPLPPSGKGGGGGAATRAAEVSRFQLLEGKVKSTGATALHMAAKNGQAACIELLLQAGADPLARLSAGVPGATPLFLAVQGGHSEAVAALAAAPREADEEGAGSVEGAGSKAGSKGGPSSVLDEGLDPPSAVTPLLVAIEMDSASMVAQLLALGANPDKGDGGGSVRQSPILFSTIAGRVSCVKALLEGGANCAVHVATSLEVRLIVG